MALLPFFNMRKPRQFEHTPIYFDPRKEALKKRIHKVKMDLGVEETDYEQYKEAIRGTFAEGSSHLKRSKNKGDNIRNRVYKNMRLLLFLAILGFLYWFFFLK